MQAKIYEYLLSGAKPEIIVTNDEKEANLCADAAIYAGFMVFVLPDLRAKKGDDLRAFNGELLELSKVLSNFYANESTKKLIISPIRTILNPLPSRKNLKIKRINLAQKIDTAKLRDELNNFGYEIVDIVQEKGEARICGDIVDIFGINADFPTRILLDFDEVISIKTFDPATQKSNTDELKMAEFTPFLAALNSDEIEKLSEKIQNTNDDALIKDVNSFGFWFIDGFENYLEKFDCVLANSIDKTDIETDLNLDFLNSLKPIPEPKDYKDLQTSISKSLIAYHKDKKITILSANESSFNALDLSEFTNIRLKISPLILNVISERELIISVNRHERKRRIRKASLVLDELKSGDFIVHEEYGIGKFGGLELISVLGSKREFVVINYLGGDRLLLPVEHLNVIDRYIANSGSVAVLDKLGKASFAKIKEKVREKLFSIASAIISTAAKRELISGVKFSVDERYDEFRARAGFIYTDDQENAVNAILKDLQSGKVMDRLLSGDVGFGKTEVAMNAIYLCVKSGFQALFFVPTTLLSAQHFKTLKSRLEPFEIPVFRYDRFSSNSDKIAFKKALEDKTPLVVVGTHALLSLSAPNLGLIIIDEEHKFGVKQKEKLKNISENSHILSMSATPIPRSLNMALSKVKSYSTLTTAPLERLDVRTFVKEFDETLLKEIIMREIRRKGQIFYVHNLISDINLVTKNLKSLIPNARILVLHSQIDAKTTEDEMTKFSEGEYDILLCTSIVESGIHLPNANTIIIEAANKFGMADLHQLRGRVGRGARQGYCYFFVENEVSLSEDAKKRLIALESNSFLGSGAVLAYHDLEIRGGGNLLGEAQSGHIEQIGYALYLKMLENEINSLLSVQKDEKKPLEIKLSINAFLNSELISEDRLRLELYRRLSKCESPSEVYEIGAEIEDRFGKLDIYTKQFLDLIIVKILAVNSGFKALSSYEQNISLTNANDEKIVLKSPSRDDDDILDTLLKFLRKKP